ncbi:hypothetical protein B0A52_00918 [Exophiala mesophila]|uniref:Uncharacterized protein n=1 Tax=Exophiala mesophila TaxID=212818 RepID=A0A438NIK8_EXOME|nr:hypothetical protein B0A52_00918 [Exophiala mesophila]
MFSTSEEIVSSPKFRIITTLKYILFNQADLNPPQDDVKDWQNQHETNLALHTERLQKSAEAFGWNDLATHIQQSGPSLLEQHLFQAAQNQSKNDPSLDPEAGSFRMFRTRLEISNTGSITVTITAMTPASQPISLLTHETSVFNPPPRQSPPPLVSDPSPESLCQLGVDTQATASTLFTTHKTSYRAPYDTARSRSHSPQLTPTTPPTKAEVLLFNPQREITEASFSTVYFFRGGQWITPHASCGGNLGVTRRRALAGGFCVEGVVTLPSSGAGPLQSKKQIEETRVGGQPWQIQHGEIVWLSNAVRGFFKARVALV